MNKKNILLFVAANIVAMNIYAQPCINTVKQLDSSLPLLVKNTNNESLNNYSLLVSLRLNTNKGEKNTNDERLNNYSLQVALSLKHLQRRKTLVFSCLKNFCFIFTNIQTNGNAVFMFYPKERLNSCLKVINVHIVPIL